MTDTPLDLDFIEHRMASPMVTYRESVEEDMPALVTALRKAEAQVAAVLALHPTVRPDGWEYDMCRRCLVPAPCEHHAAVDGAS